MRNKTFKRIAAITALLLMVSYFSFKIVMMQIGSVVTETAVVSSVNETVRTTGFVVRDEAHIVNGKNTSILRSPSDGVYIALVEDGSRVAARDTVALRFPDSASAQAYSEKKLLDEKIEYYKRLQAQTVLSFLDVGTLDNRADTGVANYIDCIDDGRLSELEEVKTSIEHILTSRQIATGKKINFSKLITKLQKQRSQVSYSQNSAQRLSTTYAGCYVSTVDGYEELASFKDVKSLTSKQIDKLIKSKPEKISKNAFGKVIGAFDWYVVCNVPSTVLNYVSVGTTVGVSFGETGSVHADMDVYSVKENNGGTLSLVLKGDTMNSELANLRIETVNINVKTHRGYRVNNSALRQNGDELGVYILYGNSVCFRKVDVSYYGNGFVVIEPDENLEQKPKTLKQYDKVITKGRNLYDGKIIHL